MDTALHLAVLSESELEGEPPGEPTGRGSDGASPSNFMNRLG